MIVLTKLQAHHWFWPAQAPIRSFPVIAPHAPSTRIPSQTQVITTANPKRIRAGEGARHDRSCTTREFGGPTSTSTREFPSLRRPSNVNVPPDQDLLNHTSPHPGVHGNLKGGRLQRVHGHRTPDGGTVAGMAMAASGDEVYG